MEIDTRIKEAWELRLKLWAESSKLWAEGRKLRAEGDIAILSAIVEVYGNIKIEWKNWNEKHDSNELHLENGIVFGFDD